MADTDIPVSLLSAATATGAGSSTALGDFSPSGTTLGILSNFTVQATMGGGVVATAVTVALEGSIDNSNWFSLASHAFTAAEITAEAAMFHVVNKAVPFIRGNLTTLTGGTNPTITMDAIASEN